MVDNKRLAALVFSVSISIPLSCALSETLVWCDEFNETVLDETKWSYSLGANWGQQELQYYTKRPENIFIEDGNLVIQALQERYRGHNYTSGRIFTKNKADFLYGRMEIRARLPTAHGMWPAIWMLPTNHVHGPGIRSGEMDIMELVGRQPSKVYATVHYGNSIADQQKKTRTKALHNSTYGDDFHVFSLDWRRDNLTFWVDRDIILTFDKTEVSEPYTYPFDDYFYFILNVAVGGTWPHDPDNTTQFPQRMEVDYVRVYLVA